MGDIDVNTGLPTPPEGLFWRVEEKRYYNDDGSSAMYVTLVRKQLVKDHVHKHVFLWFTKRVEIETIEDLTVYSWPVQYPWVTDSEKIKPQGDMDFRTVEPADILRTAELIMDMYEREVKARGLLGDYPPKTLPEIKENTDGQA